MTTPIHEVFPLTEGSEEELGWQERGPCAQTAPAATLAGLTGQTRPPDQVIAVDTASDDDSVQVLCAALGAGRVLAPGPDGVPAGFGAAVAAGLAAMDAPEGTAEPSAGSANQWLWL